MASQIMDLPSKVSFLWRIYKATEARKLLWFQGRDEYWFHTRIGRFAYVIRSVDGDDLAPYELRILLASEDEDARNTLIETWEWDMSGESPLNDPLEALYSDVKRKTLGFDDLANDMLAELAKLEEPE